MQNQSNSSRRYLITGATGFLGGELARQLLSKGAQVRLLVRDKSKAKAFADLGAEIVEGDLSDNEALLQATKDIFGVHHIAAIYRQANVGEDVFNEINVEGTKNLLDASIANGVQRFIHCSTGGVLGGIKNPPGNEKTPYNPGDMYQRSKVEGEKLVLDHFKSGKIRGAILRPGMIYGPGDTRHLKMFRMIAQGRFFYVGNGQTHVHFVDVRDVAKAFRLAMQHEEVSGEIYHIPGATSVPLKNVVEIICERLGVSEPWLHIPVKPMQALGGLCELVCVPFGINPPLYRRRVDFFTKTRHFDGSKAARELGYKPALPLKEEVIEAVDWYKTHGWI